MVTTGKKFSSAVAVACVWIGGSVLVQLLALGVALGVLRPRTEGGAAVPWWWGAAVPLVACLGGTLAVWALRAGSGWPKLPLGRLFLLTLAASVLSLPLLTLRQLGLVAFVANVLAILVACLLTWREAAGGSLGTHLFPGSTLTPKSDGDRAAS